MAACFIYYTFSSKYLLFGTLNEYCCKKVSTAVTNNSSNINKVNNHLLLQIIEHKNTTFFMEILVLALDTYKYVVGLRR